MGGERLLEVASVSFQKVVFCVKLKYWFGTEGRTFCNIPEHHIRSLQKINSL